MTVHRAVRRDVKATVTVGLGGIADITGATVRAHLRSGTTRETLTGAIGVAVATATTPCTAVIQLGTTAAGWLTVEATPNRWWMQTELEWADGTKLTWPAEGWDYLDISPDLEVD